MPSGAHGAPVLAAAKCVRCGTAAPLEELTAHVFTTGKRSGLKTGSYECREIGYCQLRLAVRHELAPGLPPGSTLVFLPRSMHVSVGGPLPKGAASPFDAIAKREAAAPAGPAAPAADAAPTAADVEQLEAPPAAPGPAEVNDAIAKLEARKVIENLPDGVWTSKGGRFVEYLPNTIAVVLKPAPASDETPPGANGANVIDIRRLAAAGEPLIAVDGAELTEAAAALENHRPPAGWPGGRYE